jgi:hypothetical protein
MMHLIGQLVLLSHVTMPVGGYEVAPVDRSATPRSKPRLAWVGLLKSGMDSDQVKPICGYIGRREWEGQSQDEAYPKRGFGCHYVYFKLVDVWPEPEECYTKRPLPITSIHRFHLGEEVYFLILRYE